MAQFHAVPLTAMRTAMAARPTESTPINMTCSRSTKNHHHRRLKASIKSKSGNPFVKQTLAVLLGNGVTEVPLQTAFTMVSRSLMKTVKTLTSSLITAQWIAQVNVAITLALLTTTTRYHWIAPIANVTAVKQRHKLFQQLNRNK
jgi:hypothetical protein